MTDKVTLTGVVSAEKQWYNDKISKTNKAYQNFKFELNVTDAQGNVDEVKCIAWYDLAKAYKDFLKVGTQCTVVGEFKDNVWDGVTTTQLICDSIVGTKCAPRPEEPELPPQPVVQEVDLDDDESD